MKLVGRRAVLGLAAALALSPLAAHAQPVSLIGHWQGSVGPLTVDIVIQANGQYGSRSQMNGMMAMQTGHAALAGGILRFHVEDYAPRTQTMVGANHTTYQTNLAQPPDSAYRVVSLTATQLVLDDVGGQGQITLRRVG